MGRCYQCRPAGHWSLCAALSDAVWRPYSTQTAIIESVRRAVLREYPFLLAEHNIQVISGREEGIYQWIAINFALGRSAGRDWPPLGLECDQVGLWCDQAGLWCDQVGLRCDQVGLWCD